MKRFLTLRLGIKFPTLVLSILLISLANYSPVYGSETIQIGSGTLTTGLNEASPINITNQSIKSQWLYTREEISDAGIARLITGFGLYVNTAPVYELPGFTIKMKHTSATNSASHDDGPFTVVYQSESYSPKAGGFDMLQLTRPFFWNGQDNLLVEVCFDPVQATSNSGTIRFYSVSNGFRFIRNNTGACGLNTTSVSSRKPQAQLVLEDINVNDAGLISIIDPVMPFAAGERTVQAELFNFGSNDLTSAQLNWEVNGQLQSPVNWTGQLPSNASQKVNLGSFNFDFEGVYDIIAWASNPNNLNDELTTNDTVSVYGLITSMEGVYTAGGSSTDFNSVQEAADEIVARGITGDVIFNLRPGIYNEQVIINPIPGTSEANTVTFRSETLSSDDVQITFSSSSSDNYLIRINGASYLRFEEINFQATNSSNSRIFSLGTATNHIKIQNSVFSAPYSTVSSTARALIFADGNNINSIDVMENVFQGGAYGVYFNAGSAGRSSDIQIQDNQFQTQGYRGIDINQNVGFIIERNTFFSTGGNYIGIHLNNSIGQKDIIGNRFNVVNGNYGIYLINSSASDAQKGLIANNFIRVGSNSNAHGISLNWGDSHFDIYHNNILITGTHATNGRGISAPSSNNSNLNLKNNNIVNTGGGYAVYLGTVSGLAIDHNNYLTSGADLARLGNNIASDLAQWQTITGQDASSLSLDPNYNSEPELYANRVDLVGAGVYVGIDTDIDGLLRDTENPVIGANELTPPENDAAILTINLPAVPFDAGMNDVNVRLRNNGALNLSSVNIEWIVNQDEQQEFQWTGNLAPGAETDVTVGSFSFEINTRYDLKIWSSMPNGQPDAFNLNDTLWVDNVYAGLNGEYTAGGSNPDFDDLTQAVTNLNLGGVTGPVIFNIRSGSFNEQLIITGFPGSSEDNTVIFQSESGNAEDVTITFNSTVWNENYTLLLNRARNMVFQNLTMAATNGSNSRIIDMVSAENILVTGNIFQGVANAGNTNARTSVYAGNSWHRDVVVTDNIFKDNSYALYLYSSTNTTGTLIEDNVFENQSRNSLYIRDQINPVIRGNDVFTSSATTSFRGIELWSTAGGFELSSNKVTANNGNYGIYLNSANGSETDRGLLFNNFIHIQGSGGYDGIYNTNSSYLNVLFNNVNVTGSSSSSRAFFTTGGNNISLLNNIFSNDAGGYAIYMNTAGSVSSIDHNNYWTTGSTLGYWSNADVNTFEAWKTASGEDENSWNVDPLYVSASDLHVRQVALKGQGTPIEGITVDIDGDERDSDNPDIGADEFPVPENDAGLLAFTSPEMPFPAGENDVKVMLVNNGGNLISSVEIYWEVNDAEQTLLEWSGTLEPGDETEVTLGAFNFSAGVYHDIVAWTQMPNRVMDEVNFNDTISIAGLTPALLGEYTVGGEEPDFSDLTSAVEALENSGVLGAVEFLIRPGIYNEQLVLTAVEGVNLESPVTFRSESGDSTDVVIAFDSGFSNNYIVFFNGAGYFNLESVTLEALNTTSARLVEISNGASHINIRNNQLKGSDSNNSNTNRAAIYSASTAFSEISIADNYFLNGSYGVYLTPSWNSYQGPVEITGNTFYNQFSGGIYMQHNESPYIFRNTIFTDRTSASYTGIYTISRNGTRILSNNVNANEGNRGIWANVSGSENSKELIANNFVYIGGSSGSAYGIYLQSSSHTDVYHNNVHLTTDNNSSRALFASAGNNIRVINNVFAHSGSGYGYYTSSATNIINSDHNNIYVPHGIFGYWNNANVSNFENWQAVSGFDANSLALDPMFISDTDLHVNQISLNKAGIFVGITEDIDGDERDLVTPDIGADEFDLSALDVAMVSVDEPAMPFAFGNTDVVVTFKNNGTQTLNSLFLLWSVNGESQSNYQWTGELAAGESAQATIGAYDFQLGTPYEIVVRSSTPNGQSDQLAVNDTTRVENLYAAFEGVFTIGGNNPDFSSFTEAVDVLNVGGVTGPVTFNVRPGEYEEQIQFNLFPGASEENRVTFRSESEDNTSVNLRFNSSSGSNYIIRLDQARYLTFKDMTFEPLNASHARIADIVGTTRNVSFINNRFLGVQTTNTSTIRALVFSNSEPFSNIHFEGNYFEKGSYAIYMIGSSNRPGTLIHQNQFSGQYRFGIYLRNHTAPHVTENTLETETVHGSYYAIYLESSPGASDVSRNRIFGQNNGRGIGFWSSNGGAERSLISNNFIQIGTTNAAGGIYLQSSNDVDIVYNTVNILSTALAVSHAALFEWSQNLLIKNNIFASTSGAYAISFTPTSYAFTSDHNNLYTTGNILGSFGGDIADLISWQNQTGRDASSLSVDPLFVSETDLYINQNALVGAATPFEKVLVDIDNNTRDPLAPVIGAHELTTATEDAAITELVAPAVPFSEGVNEVEIVLLNNALNPLTEVTINWSVNDLEQAPFQWHGNLAPGATQQVNIGEFNFLSGELYNIKVFSSMPNGLEDQRPQNDTIWVEGLYAGLNGTYSIGGELADFENFSQAIQALNDGGVAGPVIFMVADGTYNEQLVLNKIAGASQDNTITFKGESAVQGAVTVEFDAGSQPNYTLRLNNTSHVHFEWITFNSLNTSNARVVSMGGELSGISFHRSVFRGRSGSSTNSNHTLIFGDVSRLTHVQFTENLFYDGSYGVQLSGNSSNADQAVVFEGNAFRDQHYMALSLTHVTAPVVHKNIFTSPDAGNNYYGVYLSNANEGARIAANRIYDISGGYGILITGSGSSLNRGNILNNYVEMSGTGTTHGIHITSSDRFNIYHNTVNVTGTHSSSGRAFHISHGANNLLRNNVFANTGGGYAIYVNTSGSLSSSDFNNLFTMGSVLGYWNNGNASDFEAWKTQSGQDGNSLNLDPGFISKFSPMLAQASLSTAGIALANVTTDIDGNPRSPVNPSMGAMEFLPLNQHDAAVAELLAPLAPFASGEQEVMVRIRNNGAQELTSLTFQWTVNGQPQAELVWTGELLTGQEESVVVGSYDFQEATRYKIFVQSVNPNGEPDEDTSNNSVEVENVFPALVGSYTLGGTAADFSSLGLAADNLNFGGVLDDVDILVNAGTYNHQLHLKAYPGMSSDRRVKFRSADNDNTQVVLFYSASSNAENYTVFLDGASNVTFEHLTLEARDNNRSIVVELANNARNNIFTGNIFKGVISPNNSSGRALVYAPSSSGNNLLLEGNHFLDGSMGVYLNGGNRTGIVLKNNVFTNQFGYGVYLIAQNQPIVEGNTIFSESSYHSYRGLYLRNIANGARVYGNRINASRNMGIHITSGSGTSALRFLVANNFVHVGGSSQASGIYLQNTNFVNLYYNSINVTSSNASSHALYSTGGQNINLINNIFSNKTGGYSIYINTPSAISSSNHNNFFYTGNVLGYWSGNRSDLTQWQTATGNDGNSLSVDPLFPTDTNLHVSQPLLVGAATPLSAVPDDIDGDPRDADNPTIGADEFEPLPNDIGPVALISPTSDCELGEQELVTVRIQNVGTNPQSNFDISFVLDGEIVTENFGGMQIQPFETADFTFSQTVDLSKKGDYIFTLATILEGDENPLNDTLFNRQVVHHEHPVVEVTPDTSICQGESVVLAAQGGVSYLWSNGAHTSFIVVSPDESQTYTVTAFSAAGCSTEATVFVEVRPAAQVPIVSINGQTEFCQGGSVLLISDIEDNIVWSDGSTNHQLQVFQSGNYTVTHTNDFGCQSVSDPVDVTIYPVPQITVNNPGSLCPETELILTVSHGQTFSWQSGQNTQSIIDIPEVSTEYVVIVEDIFGCDYELSYFAEVLELEIPGQVSNMIPANQSVDLSLPVAFSWAPADDADLYDLFVWPQGEDAPETPTVSSLSAINRNFNGPIPYGQTYNWRVDARNACQVTQGPVQSFTLRDLPDLIVENVNVPSVVFAGETLDISFEVKNTGTGTTGAQPWVDAVFVSFNAEFDNTAIRVGEFNNQSYLNAGQSYVQNLSVNIPGNILGVYYVFVRADNRNRVLEVTTDNNLGRNEGTEGIPFVLPPMANLVALTLNVGEIAFSGDEVNITYSARNDGDIAAAGKEYLTGIFGYNPANYSNYWSMPSCIFSERVWIDGVFISQDPFYEPLDAENIKNNIVRIRSEKYEGLYFCDNLGQWLNTPDFLDVGEEYQRVVPIQIPHQIQGTWYIHVVLNAAFAFDEFNKLNNVITSQPIDIVLRPPPDLVVDNIQAEGEMVASSTYTIEWTVKNQGANKPIEKSWRDAIYLSQSSNLGPDAIYLNQQGVTRGDTLSPGSTYALSRNVTIPDGLSGDYFLHVYTDAANDVFEGPFDTNNVLSVPVSILAGSYPDLIVSEITIPDEIVAGESATVSWTVFNQGEGPALGNWRDRVYISGNEDFNPATATTLLTRSRVAELDSDESYYNQENVTIPAQIQGSYYIHVITDLQNAVYEDGRDDNNLTTSDVVNILPKPEDEPSDLAIIESGAPETANSGEQISVSWLVENLGPGVTNRSSWGDRVYLHTEPQLEGATFMRQMNRNAALDVGQTYHRFTNLNLPNGINGQYYIIIVADATNLVYDDNRENNKVIIPIDINLALSPDLIVESFEIDEVLYSGLQFTAYYTVKNVGEAAASGSWTDGIRIHSSPEYTNSGRIVGNRRSNNVILEPGESYSASITVTIPSFISGNRYFVLKTDVGDQVYEHGEAAHNNVYALLGNILVPQPSDLIVEMLDMPQSAITGEDISIEYTVTNIGVNAAIGSLRDAVHLSTDQELNIAQDPIVGFNQVNVNIGPGESQTRTLNTKVPGIIPADYYGIARTNIVASIPEIDFSNNTLVADLPTAVSMHELPVDVLVETDLNLGDKVYYWIDVDQGKDMIITITSNQLIGENEVYVAYDKVPDRVDFDFLHSEPSAVDQTVLVPSTFEGIYYIKLATRSSFSTSQVVNIHAELLPFGIHAISPSNVGQGRVTTKVTGAGFHPDAVIYISDSNGEIISNGTITNLLNSMQMHVRWELHDVPVGTYNVSVVNPEGEIETLENGLTVETVKPFELAEYAVMPNAIAAGGSAFYSFNYRNISNVDIPYSQVRITFPLGTNIVNLTTSSNAFRLSDIFQGIDIDEEIVDKDFFDNDFYRTIPIFARDLRPGESISASFVFRRFPEFTFSVYTEQATYYSDEYIRMLGATAEYLRQYLIDNSEQLTGPDLQHLISQTVSKDVFRDYLFNQYINLGLVNPQDTIGLFTDCFQCQEIIDELAESETGGYYTFDPGDSPGLEVINNNLNWNSGESYLWDINRSLYWPEYQGPRGVAGEYPGWDLIRVNGTLNVTASEINPFTIYMRSLGYNNFRGNLAGWYPAADVCWPILVAENITGFDPQKFIVNSYYFELYNQVHGGTFEITMSPGADTLYLCFRAYVPGVGENGVPGAPGVFCEPGSLGGKGGPGDGNIPPGRGGRGGDGGNCFTEGMAGGDGGRGGAGGDGGFGQDGGAGGDGGNGGTGGPNAPGGDGGAGGPGGEAGSGANGGPGGKGGDAGSGGEGFGIGGNGGPGGLGGLAVTGGIGGTGGTGGGAGIGPGGPGNPGPGGPGGFPGGDDGPTGDDPPPCCPPPPTPPPPPPGSGPEPPGPPPPPGSTPPPGEGPPPPPPPCCGPETPDFPSFPDPDPPGTDPFGPAGCGQAPPVTQNQCNDRFRNPDICRDAAIGCGLELLGALVRWCRIPVLCAAVTAAGVTVCIIETYDCVNQTTGNKRSRSHCRPVVRSCDPNDILGPEGYGDERFVSVHDELGYTIRFENDPELAEGPAQVVLITQDLNQHVNPLSFRLGNFGFADYVFEVPAGMASYNTRLDLRDSLNIYLDVVAGVNVTNNQIFWLFTSVDPATGATPDDPFTGFLAVNDSIGSGEGFVTYSIYPESESSTGDIIFAEASIIFDVNEPIITPEIFNTIDALPPSSQMDELAEFQFASQISLSWTAADDTGGSGVRDFFLYVSEDGGPISRNAGPIDGNSYTFAGEPGIEYGFAVRARDNVFNLEPYKDAPETTTMIDPDMDAFITIQSPALDDVFCVGTELSLQWLSFGVERVSIEITPDGEQYNELFADTLVSVGAVNWYIPWDYEPGNSYQVRITSLEDETVQALSDLFAIADVPVVDGQLDEVYSLCEGSTLILSVDEIAEYQYQWYLGEEELAGAQQAELEVSEPGTYYVHITNASGCILILHAEVELLDATPQANFDPVAGVCLDDEAFVLAGGMPAGGVYSGPGVTDGIFDPQQAGAGSHELTYTFTDECGSTSAVTTITVLDTDFEVSLADFDPVCDNIEPFTLTGGYPAGGTYSGPGVSENVFDPAEAGVGVHQITYIFTASCGEGEATTSLEVLEGTPEAFFEPIADVCFDDAAFELTTGSPAGGVYSGPGVSEGVFDPQAAGTGMHELSYTLSGGCGTSTATITITVLDSDFEVNLPVYDAVCINREPFALTGGTPAGGTYSGAGISEGVFNPSEVGMGIHEITYTFSATCGEGVATSTIEVTESTPQASLESFEDVCAGEDPFALTGGLPAGGEYSGTGVVGGLFYADVAGVGTHKITYTYTDDCGSTAAVTTITVFESVPELVLTDAILYLDENGTATLTVDMVDAGSFDICGDLVLSVNTELFTCDDLGDNPVEVAAVNGFGQTAAAMITVTIVDELSPVVITRDIVVQLDENGIATIEAEDIDDGSYDNCEIADMTLDQFTFDETSVGFNTVTLTVTDSSGNKSSAIAEVLVEPYTSAGFIHADISFRAYPNPFSQSVYFEFRPDVSADALLEIYDVKGALIKVLYEGPVYASQYYRIQYSASDLQTGVFVYILRLDDKVIIGRLLHAQ